MTKIPLVKIMIAHFDFCGGPQLTPIDDRAVILNSNLDAALSLANKKKRSFLITSIIWYQCCSLNFVVRVVPKKAALHEKTVILGGCNEFPVMVKQNLFPPLCLVQPRKGSEARDEIDQKYDREETRIPPHKTWTRDISKQLSYFSNTSDGQPNCFCPFHSRVRVR